MAADSHAAEMRSLHKCLHVAEKKDSIEVPHTLGPAAKKAQKQKIFHRQVSFSHPSVKVSPSSKYSQWPDGLIRKLDLKRLEQDRKRGFALEVIREDNVVKGKSDPWSLPPAGSPGNLYSGYGNNRKMFHNVRRNGD